MFKDRSLPIKYSGVLLLHTFETCVSTILNQHPGWIAVLGFYELISSKNTLTLAHLQKSHCCSCLSVCFWVLFLKIWNRTPHIPEEMSSSVRAQKWEQVNMIFLDSFCSCSLISQTVFSEWYWWLFPWKTCVLWSNALGKYWFKKLMLYPKKVIYYALLPKDVFFSLYIIKY